MKKHRIIVKSAAETYTIDVEDFFDDPLMEACTRVVEKKRKLEENLSLPPFLLAFYKKKNSSEKVYNAYIVLVNSGLHKQAEVLRSIFKKDCGVDLRTEPACSK